MKTKISILIMMLVSIFFVANIYAQDEKVKPISMWVTTGEGPLSDGPFLEANFAKGKDIINVSLGLQDMYAVYLKGFGSRFNVGPSLEWYHNVPLVGLMAFSTPIKAGNFSVGTMTWGGYSAGNPDEKVELLNWHWLFFWQSVDLNYKNFTATGAILEYDGNWGPLVDFKYKQPITKKHWQLFTSAGYSWYEDGKALLKMGLIYNFD